MVHVMVCVQEPDFSVEGDVHNIGGGFGGKLQEQTDTAVGSRAWCLYGVRIHGGSYSRRSRPTQLCIKHSSLSCKAHGCAFMAYLTGRGVWVSTPLPVGTPTLHTYICDVAHREGWVLAGALVHGEDQSLQPHGLSGALVSERASLPCCTCVAHTHMLHRATHQMCRAYLPGNVSIPAPAFPPSCTGHAHTAASGI
jgi:hypothetical protein